MKQFRRSDRLGVQILKDISIIVESQLRETAPGMITFTHVRVSNDLRNATVYYSVLGDGTMRDTAAEFLLRNRKEIRKHVGDGLRVRHIPEISFKFDPSVAEGIKIERLLNEVNTETNE